MGLSAYGTAASALERAARLSRDAERRGWRFLRAGVAARLAGRPAWAYRLLDDASEELLAYYQFPSDHWPKLRSTNPLERVNKEIGRRSDVVGIYPNDRSLIRLAGMVLLEQNDEWLVQRRYLSEHSMRQLRVPPRPDEADTDQDHTEVIELDAA